MKKKLIIIGVLLFALLNILLAYFTFNPSTLIPLLPTTIKDQAYYWNQKYYSLGDYYLFPDQSRFVFVGKLLDVYEKDNTVFAKVQTTKNTQSTQIISIELKNGRTRFVDHPFDPLLGIYTQSHSQLLKNPQQVLYNASKYKNQNLVFFVALPSGVVVPPSQDPAIIALMKKPETIALISAQKSGADCGAKLLTDFQVKKFTPLNCIPYIAEIHVNTGSWRHQ